MTLTATGVRAERPTTTRRRGGGYAGYAFLAPVLLYVVVFFGYPLVANLVMSAQDYTVRSFYTGEAPFVGFANYAAVLANPLFTTAVLNTVLFTVGSIAFQFGIGLALAVFFSGRFLGSATLRSLLLLPWLLPLVVSGAVWRWMFDQDHGVLNAVLRLVDAPVPWLTSTEWALPAVVITNIWIGIPFTLVVLHGGLKAIPPTLYEAAELDGASGWQRFRFVTWPLLRPVTGIVLMLGLVYTIKVFDVIMVVTGGGPANATQTLTTWSYALSFRDFAFGQGAAVGNLLILVATAFGLLYLRSLRATLAEAAS